LHIQFRWYCYWMSLQDLIEDLKSELGGKFESVIVGLMMPTPAYCAKQLHKAMKGAGTDEETLVEIVCSRNRLEVAQIADAYLEGDSISISIHFQMIEV